jgi:septum formation protein
MQLILASQSKQRQRIMDTLHLPYEIWPANLDEQAVNAPTPEERAALLALRKAEKTATQFPTATIIAADSFIQLGTRSLEKPQSLEEAAEMLGALSAQRARELTGFCCIHQGKVIKNKTSITPFKFRLLTQQEIQHYITDQPVLTWSGAFSPAYDAGLCLIEWFEGSPTSFTHGLPVEWIHESLAEVNSQQ